MLIVVFNLYLYRLFSVDMIKLEWLFDMYQCFILVWFTKICKLPGTTLSLWKTLLINCTWST